MSDCAEVSGFKDFEVSNTGLHINITIPAPCTKYPAKEHARKVAARLPPGEGLIYLEGMHSQTFEDSDMIPKFRQRRYFQYLSGVTDIPDCKLVYIISNDQLILYIPPLDTTRVLWSGVPLGLEECLEKYDVDIVDTTPDIPSLLAAYYMLHPKAPIYILHPSHCSSIPDKIPSQIINCDLLQPAIDNCRVYKDAYEISLIRKANEISAAAHRRVQQLVRTAKNETELEAIFLSVCVANFAKSQAYDPICGSGRNAATLHYVKNDEPLDGRQLLLCDAGAEWEGYASDVTRTFPISGWWTQEAFAIYKLVEEMQRQCIARTIKGVDWRETHLLAHRIATKGLIELGILCGGSFDEIYCAGTSKAFFPHGLGHLMGLDVHDTEGASDVVWNSREMMGVYADIDESILGGGNVCRTLVKRVLDKDMVITVEPGIYFCEFIITPYLSHPVHGKYIDKDVLDRYWDVGGVRIEDDILILEDGNENLTTAPGGVEMLQLINKLDN